MDNSISIYELAKQIKEEKNNTSEPLKYSKPLERLENNINAIKLLKK